MHGSLALRLGVHPGKRFSFSLLLLCEFQPSVGSSSVTRRRGLGCSANVLLAEGCGFKEGRSFTLNPVRLVTLHMCDLIGL